MKIDLTKIPSEGIELEEIISFEKELFSHPDLEAINNVKLTGQIYYDSAEELVIDLILGGEMILKDAIDLSPISYPFSIKINERYATSLENSDNSLDIMSILWQNIVLEIPIRIVKPENENISLQGEGWELANEDTKKIDSRLAPLLDLLEKGKE